MAEALTMTESLLLARDQDVQPWHLVTVLVLDRPIAKADLATRIAERIAYAPRFRQKVIGVPVPTWVDDTGLRIAGHLHEVTLQADESFESWLGGTLNRPIDRVHPLWDAWLVDGLGGRTTALVVRASPALVDGAEHIHLVQELLDSDPVPVAGPAPEWEPTPAEPPGLGDLWGFLNNPVGALRDVATGLTGLAATGLRHASAAAQPRFVAGVEVDLDAVRHVRDQHGVTTHDVLLAMATAGVRGWLMDRGDSFRDPVALVPLGTADDPEHPITGSEIHCGAIRQPTAVGELGLLGRGR